MIDWSTDATHVCSASWLIDLLIGRLIDWLIDERMLFLFSFLNRFYDQQRRAGPEHYVPGSRGLSVLPAHVYVRRNVGGRCVLRSRVFHYSSSKHHYAVWILSYLQGSFFSPQVDRLSLSTVFSLLRLFFPLRFVVLSSGVVEIHHHPLVGSHYDRCSPRYFFFCFSSAPPTWIEMIKRLVFFSSSGGVDGRYRLCAAASQSGQGFLYEPKDHQHFRHDQPDLFRQGTAIWS